MKKFVMTVVAVAALSIAGSANAASMLSNYNGVNLRVGSTGTQVAELQVCMNTAGYNTGVVDGKFGPNTKAGVMSFQASNGLVVDGIVGTKTRPAFQAACMTEMSEVAMDDSNASSNTSTDTSVASSFDGNDGEEVNFTGSDLDQGGDTTIDEGSNKAELAELEFKNEDSDVLLERFDIILSKVTTASDAQATAADEEDAWKIFDTLYIYVDGDKVAEMDSDDKDDWQDRTIGNVTIASDDDNRFRISGINTVLDKEEDHKITIKADINSSVDMDANGAQWALVVDESTARFVDEAGITQYLSEEDGNNEMVATFAIVEAGNQDELQVKSSNDDPDATTLEVKSSQESDEYMVFAFDVEADEDGGDLEIEDIVLTAATGTKNFADVVSEVTLKIDGEEEDYDVATSTNLASTAATLKFDFDGKEISIDKGDKEKAEIYVKFKSTNNQVAYGNGETIKFSVTGANVDAWDVDGSDSLSGTQLTGSATGDTHQLSEEGVIANLKSSSVAMTTTDAGEVKTATYTMEVELEAFGDTFFVGKVAQNAAALTGTNAVAFSVEDSADAAVANSTVSFALASSASTDGATAFRIDEGEKETVTLTATVEIAAAGADTYTRVQLNQVKVFTDNALTAGGQVISLLPVEDYESPLQLINNL